MHELLKILLNVITMETEKRKADHIEICLKKNVEVGDTWFDCVVLVHNALPNIDFSEISTKTEFLGKELEFPLLIEAMTGGTKKAEKINKVLATAAQSHGIAFGVGSQRAGIEKPELAKTYKVRDVAPDVFLVANIGLVQFINEYKPEVAKEVVDMIDADALALHLNPLQEIFQPEGDVNWKGAADIIKDIVNVVDVPVIVKETGAGISKDVAKRLEDARVCAIDISGFGGTSWSVVEAYRTGKGVSEEFLRWGIPTAASLIEVSKTVKIPVIASGGIRNGVDGVKSLVLGASLFGVAKPFLNAVFDNNVDNLIARIKNEFKKTMFLVGSKNITELGKTKYVVLAKLKEWIDQRVETRNCFS